jgi:hypothetical protein
MDRLYSLHLLWTMHVLALFLDNLSTISNHFANKCEFETLTISKEKHHVCEHTQVQLSMSMFYYQVEQSGHPSLESQMAFEYSQ